MSNAQKIIDQLTSAELLTTVDKQTLETTNSDQQFLTQLIAIYERRMHDYITACKRSMQRRLVQENIATEHIDSIATQYIVQSAYAAELTGNHESLLMMLYTLLLSTSPELAISIGMQASIVHNGQIQHFSLSDQIITVFVKYMARHRMFIEAPTVELQAICAAIQHDAPTLFPAYLFNSLLQQKILVHNITQRIATQTNAETNIEALWRNELVHTVQTEPAEIFHALKGLMYYSASVLNSTHIPHQLRPRFFAYLNDETQKLAFVNNICHGFIQSMQSVAVMQQTYVTNKQLLDDPHNQICIPMLPLIGITIVIPDDLDMRKQQLTQTIQQLDTYKAQLTVNLTEIIEKNRVTTAEYKAQVKQQLDAAQATVHQQVAQAVDRINQDRANFRPHWEISTIAGPQSRESVQTIGPLLGPRFNF